MMIKIKKLNLGIALLFCCLVGNAQFFEGKVIYKNTYESRIPNLSSDKLNLLMGTTQEYFIKDGDFKIILDGQFLKAQIYHERENKAYVLTSRRDTIYWEDGLIAKDTPVSYEIQENKEIILNVMCDLLIVKTNIQTVYYYFNRNNLLVDVEAFDNTNYNNWYYTISKAKALSYKTIIETSQYTATSTAIQIEEMKLKKSFFDLPSLPLIRSRW